jgi:predicted NBD/HSP70 family sugar kinase
MNKSIGLDVGGSHVSASVIDLNDPQGQILALTRMDIDPLDTADRIVEKY